MALKDKIPKILDHITKYKSNLEYNYRLYLAYEGQIKKEIEDSMRQEILSPHALRRALQRIPSINILQKGIDKLSTVYAEPVKRFSVNATDTEIMENIVKMSRLDTKLMSADVMANLQKRAAIEPYLENGVHQFRIYGAHQFLPFGDDPLNPMKMTVFIKMMGKISRVETVGESINPLTGIKNEEASQVIREVRTYLLYSDQEVLYIDETGKVLSEEQRALGIPTRNEFGVIPQIYINKSNFELIPFPDTAGLDTAILIPKLLTDLNYAVQFMSHSIIWTKNADLGNQEINPDVIVDLGDSDIQTGKDPGIGVITPQVDIMGVLQMVEFELNGYFASIGIKTSSLNGLKPGREVSGIAKAIDEGDTTLVRRKNIEFFKEVEYMLWEKMEKIQNAWASMGMLTRERRKFTDKLSEDMTVIFGEVKIIETVQDKVLRLQAQDQFGVITRKDIVKEFNPDFSEAQIEKRLEDVKSEKEEAMRELDARIAAMDNGDDTAAVPGGAENGDSGRPDRRNQDPNSQRPGQE